MRDIVYTSYRSETLISESFVQLLLFLKIKKKRWGEEGDGEIWLNDRGSKFVAFLFVAANTFPSNRRAHPLSAPVTRRPKRASRRLSTQASRWPLLLASIQARFSFV